MDPSDDCFQRVLDNESVSEKKLSEGFVLQDDKAKGSSIYDETTDRLSNEKRVQRINDFVTELL
eukprot:CAMPEP_0170558736 /NCGR_PEP_ID=MMETSP0211-20121228/37492_1 /TAXON_ID=311385 /ORGANISM="Pseudokeronopsis sp., Strain OXSARD2" /LENGTH=63 /DNA_ID=CAMNT_0010870987 /DNA_START=171 /DNA_END=362 /DNA_ORIENTATION=-